MSRNLSKLLLWSLGLGVGLVVMLGVAVLMGAHLIDTPRIRAQLADRLSTLVSGQVSWQALDIELLPMPHGVVRGLRVAIPDVVTVDIATADVKIRLLPLLRGSVEVQAFGLQQPTVEVWVAKSAADAVDSAPTATPANPLDYYRNAMRPVLDAVARHAPDTTIVVEDGRAALHLFSMPILEASQLDLQIETDARGVSIDASANGTHWDRIAIRGRVEFEDLEASVVVDGTGLRPQPALESLFTGLRETLVLPNVGTRVEVHTDGQTSIDLAFDLDLPKAEIQRAGQQLDIAQVRIAGSVKFIDDAIDVAFDKVQFGELIPAAEVTLMLAGRMRAPRLGVAIENLDLSRLRNAAMVLAGDQPVVQEYIARIHAGQVRDLRFAAHAESFATLFALPQLRVSAQLVDGSLRIPALEREATRIDAHAELADSTIRLSDVSARIGASQLRQAGVDVVLLEPRRIESAHGLVNLALHDLLPDLRTREPFANALRDVPVLTGSAEANVRKMALRFDQPQQLAYDIVVRPRHVGVDVGKPPQAVEVHGGTVSVTSKRIQAERVGVSALDSQAVISGELTDFRNGKSHMTAAVSDGVAGRKLIDWVWLRAGLDERLKPATPLRFTARRVQLNNAVLDVIADASIDAGPTIGVDLSVADKVFTLRRATLKDRESDAALSFAMRDASMEAGFAGTLAAHSLARLLGRTAEGHQGSVRGDLQATFDRERHERAMARGHLVGERLDLRTLTGLPLRLEEFDLQGDGSTLQIHKLGMAWADQKASIRGAIKRTGSEIEAKLEVDSPGVVVEAVRDSRVPQSASKPSATQEPPARQFDLWSLPLKGSVALRSDFVEYAGYRVQGVRAVATLDREQGTVDLAEATVCGIAVPLQLRVTPDHFDARLSVTAMRQSIEGTAQCLAGKHVVITGDFNLSGELTASGRTEHIGESMTDQLAGSLELLAENGVIQKMALLGNILSLKSVSELRKGGLELGGQGIEYRSIGIGARIKDGTMTLEQAALDSPALGLAATGTIDLENAASDLTVLVAPFGTLDRMVRKTPVLGYIFGGALTSIPIRVSGDLRDPVVVPLGPRAVGSEVLGVFERTFELPGKLVEPLKAGEGD